MTQRADAAALTDFDLSRRGYPGVLNRLDAGLWTAPPAAVATQYYAWQTAAGGSLWLQAG